MRKVLIIAIGISSFLLLTAGRCSLQDACAYEMQAHSAYVAFIAPFRPADKVALEQKRYDFFMSLCAAGAPPSQLDKAQASLKEAQK